MKLKSDRFVLAIFIVVVLLCVVLISSFNIDPNNVTEPEITKPIKDIDNPSVLPDWKDEQYHDYDVTKQTILELNKCYPDLVEYFSIGKTVEKRDIYCIKITNEKNNQEKKSCLIDGCIHGNEWEAGDACFYLAEYLLINFGKNKSISDILNNSEIYIVPLVNPDGREANTRWNFNCIDLNRNFDIDFGRIRGSAIRLGVILGRIKIPQVRVPFYGYLNNCGRKPFSEPESQAIRDLSKTLKNNRFSFYVNCHTAIHNFETPWSAFKPPFEISEKEEDIFTIVKDWVDSNTEYEKTDLGYHASGTVTDWMFKEYRIPSFTFEMLSQEYEPWNTGGKHDSLVHWMKTTLPVFMYLLVNIDNLYNWEDPDIQPFLPDGVPPSPK